MTKPTYTLVQIYETNLEESFVSDSFLTLVKKAFELFENYLSTYDKEDEFLKWIPELTLNPKGKHEFTEAGFDFGITIDMEKEELSAYSYLREDDFNIYVVKSEYLTDTIDE